MKEQNLAAEINSLWPLFRPSSLAIIGASGNPFKPSGQPLYSLTNNGFKGQIYPVNPKYETLLGLTCYPTVQDIPGQVDLAIIAVPARYTLAALEQCAAKGVRGVIIFTSGFAEVGPEGAAMQQQITALARKTGMRVCGPNCMGIFSADNALMANFSINELPKRVLIPNLLGFISQSGGFGNAIYQIIMEKGYGFSHFVSTGNEADLEFSHYLGYMALDEDTKVLGGYLEGVKDGPKFIQALDLALANRKPVLMIKAGRSQVAARAAASHTGALVGSDQVYDAIFKQKGVIRVESLEEYRIILSLLAAGKIPRGKRVAILATSGGSGVALADKCDQYGLEVVPLRDETRAQLDRILPDFASSANPVDITSAIITQPGLLEQCAQVVVDDPGVDMVIAAYWAMPGDLGNVQQMIRIHGKTDKPVFNAIWGPEEASRKALRYFNDHLVPAASEIDYAIGSLAALADYSHFLETRAQAAQLPGPELPPGAREKAAEVLSGLAPGSSLTEDQAKKVLRAYGIATTREVLATTPAQAVAAAAEIGYPVAMKIISPDILHKTDAGGVILNVASDQEVECNFAKILANAYAYDPSATIHGVLIQEMLPPGTEIILGVKKDPIFGATVAVGLGGIFVEALEDVSVRVVPVSPLDAGEMLGELKGKKVLAGLRGNPPADREALVDLIQRVSRLAEDFPQIAELDINPLLLYARGQGACAPDALIVLA